MKMTHHFSIPLLASLFALGLACTTSTAGEIDAGKLKAQSCAMCHGANGISMMPGAPNLAGQQAIYVSEQLKHFRNGQRLNEIMSVIAKPLTDTEIGDVAAWYESIKVTVEVP